MHARAWEGIDEDDGRRDVLKGWRQDSRTGMGGDAWGAKCGTEAVRQGVLGAAARSTRAVRASHVGHRAAQNSGVCWEG